MGDSDSTESAESMNASRDKTPEDQKPKKRKTGLILAIVIAAAVIIGTILLVAVFNGNRFAPSGDDHSKSPTVEAEPSDDHSGGSAVKDQTSDDHNSGSAVEDQPSGDNNGGSDAEDQPSGDDNGGGSTVEDETSPLVDEQFDLFSYCKNFAIEKGTLNGDFCIYQQPAANYGGYENEYFSISYWNDSNMVEFCLHCPLSETYSINFYLRMRDGYYNKYEYLSSKYYRDTGESLRSATGYIDPAVFSDSYPISCDQYEGDFDGQNDFMEESRVGLCDLIYCLKEFVKVEKMECAFSDFEFANF